MAGKRNTTLTVKAGLNDDNEPCFEGLRMYNGRLPLQERIKRKHERECVECAPDDHPKHGIFTIGLAKWSVIGLPVWKAVKFVNFRCIRCLHEEDPITFPYE